MTDLVILILISSQLQKSATTWTSRDMPSAEWQRRVRSSADPLAEKTKELLRQIIALCSQCQPRVRQNGADLP